MSAFNKFKKAATISPRSRTIIDRMIEELIQNDAEKELHKKAEGIKTYIREKGL